MEIIESAIEQQNPKYHLGFSFLCADMRFFSTSRSPNGSSHPRNGLIDFLIGAPRPAITIVDPLIPSSLVLRANEREQTSCQFGNTQTGNHHHASSLPDIIYVDP